MYDLLTELLSLARDYPDYLTIAVCLTILVVLSPYIKKIWNSLAMFIKYIRKFKSLLDLPDEMKPNGGSSLRDKIDNIHKDVLIQGNLLSGKVNTIMDYLGEAICEIDSQGHLLHATNQFYNLIGARNYDEISGFNWLNFVQQDERGEIWNEFQDAIEQKRECTLNYTLINGIKVIDKSTLIKDGSGNILRYIKRMTPINGITT